MYRTVQLVSIARAGISRVTHKVGVIIKRTLENGEELMTLYPSIVRALQLSITSSDIAVVDRFLAS